MKKSNEWLAEVGSAVTVLILAPIMLDATMEARPVGQVIPGARGTYLGRHPDQKLAAEGWHAIVVLGGFVPLHRRQFELASDALAGLS